MFRRGALGNGRQGSSARSIVPIRGHLHLATHRHRGDPLPKTPGWLLQYPTSDAAKSHLSVATTTGDVALGATKTALMPAPSLANRYAD
jgi:hypothetical protein